MATRSTTDFVIYPDERLLLPRKQVLATTINNIIDQQIEVLDCETMILSDCFDTITVDSGTLQTVAEYFVRPKDMIGALSGTYNWKCATLCWAVAGVTELEVSIDNLTKGTNVTTTYSGAGLSTSPEWRGFDNLSSNYADTKQEIRWQIRRKAGTGAVYIAGVALFAPST